MNPEPATPTGPALAGETSLFQQFNPIVSRSPTICPNCRKQTKALQIRTPALTSDPFGPPEYLRQGVYSAQMPETVTLKFTCEHCGYQHQGIIASDARFFFASDRGKDTAAVGCGPGCACSASDGKAVSPLGANAMGLNPQFGASTDHFAQLSPCVVLIEIVKMCNLSCPTCFAESAKGALAPGDYIPLEEIKSRIQGIIDRRGQDIEILQLSGGEPTLHPEFFEVIKWAQENLKIHVVMVNTNGLKLLTPAFASRFSEIADRKKAHLYLKFNGPDETAQLELVGLENGHDIELRVLEYLKVSKIATTLAMTVIPHNLHCMWKVVQLGLGVPSVRGVNFQPRFGAGRIETQMSRLVDTGHVINNLVHQGRGVLTENSILPLPCGDPNCQFIGMLVRETMTCIGSAVGDEERMRLLGFLQGKINYGAADLTKCGCETTDFGRLVGQLEEAGQMFRLSIKPFMTFGGAVHNFSCNRTDQCCTSVVGADGSLHSFCRVYNGLDTPEDGSNVLWSALQA